MAALTLRSPEENESRVLIHKEEYEQIKKYSDKAPSDEKLDLIQSIFKAIQEEQHSKEFPIILSDYKTWRVLKAEKGIFLCFHNIKGSIGQSPLSQNYEHKVQINSYRSPDRKNAPRIANINGKIGENYLLAHGADRPQES